MISNACMKFVTLGVELEAEEVEEEEEDALPVDDAADEEVVVVVVVVESDEDDVAEIAASVLAPIHASAIWSQCWIICLRNATVDALRIVVATKHDIVLLIFIWRFEIDGGIRRNMRR